MGQTTREGDAGVGCLDVFVSEVDGSDVSSKSGEGVAQKAIEVIMGEGERKRNGGTAPKCILKVTVWTSARTSVHSSPTRPADVTPP